MAISDTLKQLRDIDFAELEFNTIGVWPLPVKILLLIGIFVVVLVGGYFFHIKDQNLRLEKLEQEEARLKQTFKDRAFEAANLEAYRAQMAEVEESFGALLAQLPSDTEVPGLLEDITEIGYGSSLEIQSITLQPERAAEFYVELPIRIVARGGVPRLRVLCQRGGRVAENRDPARLLHQRVQGQQYPPVRSAGENLPLQATG
jgi:type IV pilus assembly protein PilO